MRIEAYAVNRGFTWKLAMADGRRMERGQVFASLDDAVQDAKSIMQEVMAFDVRFHQNGATMTFKSD